MYPVSIQSLAKALSQLAAHPLPDPKLVFPWLHGLHAENQMQLAFFAAHRKSVRNTPRCWRSITIAKAGSVLVESKLIGAMPASELLAGGDELGNAFLDANPREGFSVRNFQIQQAKAATISDIVVYGGPETSNEDVLLLASRFAAAQRSVQEVRKLDEQDSPEFHTFVLTCKSLSGVTASELTAL